MGRRRSPIASPPAAAIAALLALTGCTGGTTVLQSGAAGEKPSRAVAERLASQYADLVARAVGGRVSDQQIRDAGIDTRSDLARQYLDVYTCYFHDEGDWDPAHTTGHLRILSYKKISEDRIRTRAQLYLVNTDDLYTPGDEHVLDVARLDGQWRIVNDRLDTPRDGDGASTDSGPAVAADNPDSDTTPPPGSGPGSNCRPLPGMG
jgi:hypothetical protein